jgi:hypothetical protein
MKTLVIQLDHSEDIGSIRDKVTWGKASRVLLVWPVNYAVFDRKVDLMTIKRICTSQGSRLGIVSDDPVVSAEADELQIPVFDSVTRAMRKGWDRRRRKRFLSPFEENAVDTPGIEDLRTNPGRSKVDINQPFYLRVILLSAGILAVLVLLLFILPSATIRIYPQGQVREMKVEFQVDTRESGASNPGLLQGSTINATVEGQAEKQTTGSTPAADQKAKGQITVTNGTAREIDIPAKTIVINSANPPVRYQILQNVAILPKESTAGIAIEAIYAGTNGNSAVNTVSRIDGELGLEVELTNPEPVSGGSDRNIPAPSNEDIQQLRSDLQKTLEKDAEKQFSSKLNPDEVLLPSSIKSEKIISEEVLPEIGQVGMTVKLSQKAEFSAIIIHHENLKNQAEALLAANKLLPGWKISTIEPVDVQILAQEFDKGTNIVKLQTQIKGKIIPIIDTDAIRRSITGADRNKAEILLGIQVLSDQPAEIETWPLWMPYLPWLESKITIITP